MLQEKEINFLNAFIDLFDSKVLMITKVPLRDEPLCKLRIRCYVGDGDDIETNEIMPLNNKEFFIDLKENKNYIYNKKGELNDIGY